MPSKFVIYGAVTAVAVAAFYQLFLRDFLFIMVGVGRTIQPVEDFPYTCRRIKHEQLQACEDLWLDDEGRRLYLTCTGTNHRLAWNPGRPGGAYMTVLNIDEPGDDGLFGVHQLDRGDYKGSMGDGSMDMVGFDVEVAKDDLLKFYIVNNAPPVDIDFKPLDPAKAGGAQASVQVFEHKRGSKDMKFKLSFENAAIRTPNRVALTGDGGFVLTNDHSEKGGLKHDLEVFTGGGNLAYCSLENQSCHIAASEGLNFPNGLIRGADGLYYVPNTMSAKISVMELQPDKSLREVDAIHHTMPFDNLSLDKRGDIWGAGFPSLTATLASIADPWNVDWPTTVWRFRKEKGGKVYKAEKVIEDREAKVVAGATTVQHDVKTGRLFMGGAISPYIVVCDPK